MSVMSKLADALAGRENPTVKNAAIDALTDATPRSTLLKTLGVESEDDLMPLFRGQKYGTNDILYNKAGGGAAGAGATASVGNAYYFTPNKAKTSPWIGKGTGGVIEIPARKSDVMTLQDLLSRAKQADDIFADASAAQKLYNTNPSEYELMEALAERNYQDISRLTKKPFIQPDSGQGEELMETLFFPDTNPELTKAYRQYLK